MNADTLFIVGGTRSGKSALALRWAESKARIRLFVATCDAKDPETAARVARHKAERGAGWYCAELVAYLKAPRTPTAIVSAETGTSLVPTTKAGRLFQDTLGLVN